MGYKDAGWVMQDYLKGYFRPGNAKMNLEPGDTVLLVGKSIDAEILDHGTPAGGDLAVGMFGKVVNTKRMVKMNSAREPGVTEVPIYDMEWKSFPKLIDPNYTCVQSGFISLDDRAEILAQLI
jgi:hypothetical protein